MSQSDYNKLLDVLKGYQELFNDKGQLNKEKALEAAKRKDSLLIDVLFKDKETHSRFFKNPNEKTSFDVEEFFKAIDEIPYWTVKQDKI